MTTMTFLEEQLLDVKCEVSKTRGTGSAIQHYAKVSMTLSGARETVNEIMELLKKAGYDID